MAVASDDDFWRDARRVREWRNVDRACFEREIKPAGEPALIRGLVADWPGVLRGREGAAALAAYLKSFAAPRPISFFTGAPEGRYSYKDDFSGFNFERREAPLAEFLDRLIDALTDPEAPSAYAGAVNVPAHAPAFADAHTMPLLSPECEKLVSLWIGNRGRTPAHWDLPQNLACVIAGRRRFTLLPIAQVRNLYIGPLDATIAGQPTSLVDFARPDFDRFPRFREAMAHAAIAELEPGDVLYMPSLWVHHVEARDPFGVMMNFWFRDGPDYLTTPFSTLLHALITLRDMPPEERARWKVLFETYIFDEPEEAMAHLPPHAKGLFGPMTRENLQRIRERLRRSLGG
ncbi:MAG TPA: cupin-like domain-containing protein [Caulobacterales bacterium]|nr:cupin-like domain-containing protein [Caulobacterales bacterium]